jgi:aminoglycoside phosphotransferase (APT) family kinase protein
MTNLRSEQLLGAAVKTLREEILPGITDPAARIKIDHVTRLLWDVAARLSKREAGLRAYLGAASSLVPAGSAAADADLNALELQRAAVAKEICARLPDMIEEAARDRGASLRNVLQLERAFYISQDPDVANGSAVAYRGGRIEGDASGRGVSLPSIDAVSLSAYLRARMQRDDVAAIDVSRVPGGYSKDTIFFTLTDAANGSAQKLVIRKDLPVPLMGKTVINEFDLLQRLHAAGFPVAEPLWLETDTQRFGGAFIVSRRVPGTSDAAKWTGDPVRARVACEQLAKLLARLHALRPADLGIGAERAALSAGAQMEQEVAYWTTLFHRRRQEAFPLLELPLLWLAANIPAALYDRPSRVVHGDVGFHNLMFDDAGNVTALLDWEFSVLGDPTQDLCFARQFIEPLMPWTEFLAVYIEAGGEPPCAEAEFFYKLWTKTRNAVGCVDAQTLFDTAMPTEMRFALAGHIFAPYMFVDQCETLIEHLAAPDRG